ncbi:MAG: hypothetical protein WC343_00760 [Bacilli bacterium]
MIDMVGRTVYEQIAEHEDALEKLYAERDELEKMTPRQRLAVYIHEKTCHHDHIETCAWFYEIDEDGHNWDGFSHKRMLTVADTLLEGVDVGTAKKLIDSGIVRG